MINEIKGYKFLEGEKIYLRKVDISDAELYSSMLANSSGELRYFTGTKAAFNKSGTESFLQEISGDRSRCDFFIVLKEGNEIVGDIALNDIDFSNRSCNLRLAIDNEKDCGKGCGSEAISITLDYGFGMLNLHRIELEVYSFNERAIHVYEKIGFKREGLKRDALYFNHKYHDAIYMSILDSEFNKA